MTTTPGGADAALRDQLTNDMPGLELDTLPGRFLLIDYTDDSDTGSPEITGWGLQVADSALVVHRDHTISQFRHAPRAFDRLLDCHDEILWVDGDTSPAAGRFTYDTDGGTGPNGVGGTSGASSDPTEPS